MAGSLVIADKRPTVWLSGSGGTGETRSRLSPISGKAAHTFSGGERSRPRPQSLRDGAGDCSRIPPKRFVHYDSLHSVYAFLMGFVEMVTFASTMVIGQRLN